MKCKRIIILTILVLTILSLFVSAVYADVWVNGYTRKNGTYVQGYWRSSPDSDPTNNFSYPGNVNPYTGKVAPGNPETYLKNYPNYNDTSPTPQYDYINMNESARIFEIVDTQGNITGYTDTTLLPISENEDSIVSSSTYIFRPIVIKKVGFSSVDDVMTAVAINSIGKDPNAPPFTIGSSVEDVIRVMGTPESIQISFKSFKYRNSTVYFDDDWKVQSWDNRYGNLKISLENESRIDILDIDDIIEIKNDNPSENSTILPTYKSFEEIIKEYQEYLKNN